MIYSVKYTVSVRKMTDDGHVEMFSERLCLFIAVQCLKRRGVVCMCV